MITLRRHMRNLELLENRAAEKAGMRFLLLEENVLMGKDSREYVKQYINRLLSDIGPELLEAAKMGIRLNERITNA